MSSFTVKTIKLEDNFKAVIAAASGATLEKAVMAGGQVVEAYAKINANQVFSAKSTGGAGLGGSIQTVLVKSDVTSAEADVGPTVIYGRIQELGGIIKPVHKKFLHFFIDGVEVFTKLVHLPPRPYLRPAIDEHEQEVMDAIGYQLKNSIEDAAK
jgi:phage gpG-like protein